MPREQAVFNIQRTALLIDCLHRGDLSLLRFATEDVLHQPARATIYPHLKPMCQAAINAGAHGAFLSAGPTILAICSGATGGDIFTQTREERQENGVANAMRRAVDSLSTKHDQWKGASSTSARRATRLPRRLGRPAHVRRDGDVRDARRGPLASRGCGARVRRDCVRHALRGPQLLARAPPPELCARLAPRASRSLTPRACFAASLLAGMMLVHFHRVGHQFTGSRACARTRQSRIRIAGFTAMETRPAKRARFSHVHDPKYIAEPTLAKRCSTSSIPGG